MLLNSPATTRLETRNLPSRRKRGFVRPQTGPRPISIGTANPPNKFSQEDVLDYFGEQNTKVRRLFCNSHIQSRYLYLPKRVDGELREETNKELIDKHLNGVLDIGSQAIEKALAPVGLVPKDVDFFVALSSTGLLCPGITAHLTKKMGFRENIQRVDMIGMGCSAAMNGFQVATGMAKAMPGKIGVMLCVEICSAAYVYNSKMYTAVVNSLFGDGAAAAVIRDDHDDTWEQGPVIMDLEPQIVTEAIDALKYQMEGTKLSFYLDRDIPYLIGQNVEKPIKRLLGRNNLNIRDIDHWVIHSGGRKVVDALQYNLGLTDYDVRHTLHILKNYGNLSSASLLFSFNELRRENLVREGDLGVLIAMGPGTSIETGLISW